MCKVRLMDGCHHAALLVTCVPSPGTILAQLLQKTEPKTNSVHMQYYLTTNSQCTWLAVDVTFNAITYVSRVTFKAMQ